MIPGLASLRTRIFVASTLLATASIGAGVYFVSVRLTAEAEAELQRDLLEAGGLVDQQSASLFDSFTRTATLIADLPKFKAAVETRDGPTIEPIARDYLSQAGADLVVVAGRGGEQLAAVTSPTRPASLPELPALAGVRDGRPATAFWPHPSGVLQVVTVPVTIDLERPELLGTLTMGYLLDAERAGALKSLTGADIAFVYDGAVRASSFPIDIGPAVAPWIHADQHVTALTVADDDYSALVRPLAGGLTPAPAGHEPPRAVVLRSRTARMQTLGTIRTALAGIALATVALAAVLSYAIARTVTKPLATITAHMRDVAATGDLTRKVALPAVAVERRGRHGDGRDLQRPDRIGGGLAARRRAARAAVGAGPAVDRGRARDPQPADDHQGRAARRCSRPTARPTTAATPPTTSTARSIG